MAKTAMTCPFCGKPCKKCAYYRGRHYYLFAKGGEKSQIPLVAAESAVDLFKEPQKDIKTSNKKEG